MEPVDQLSDLQVELSHPAGDGPRVELVDRRRLVELVSLTPREAATLAGMLAAKAVAAAHEPGE